MMKRVQKLTSITRLGMNAYEVTVQQLSPLQLAVIGNPISCVPAGDVML